MEPGRAAGCATWARVGTALWPADGSRRTVSSAIAEAERSAGSSMGAATVAVEPARTIVLNSPEAMTWSTPGERDPAVPGTATSASTAVSAAPATHRSRRTSRRNIQASAVPVARRPLPRGERVDREHRARRQRAHPGHGSVRPPGDAGTAPAGLRGPHLLHRWRDRLAGDAHAGGPCHAPARGGDRRR